MAVKASVVVPVFNKAPFLTECFESIFAQSFTDFEVIVVDDQSTDGSAGILRELKDPRVRIGTNSSNSGPGMTAQRAMDLALGEYIIRVDADDVLMPDRFTKQIAYMDAHPEIGISGSNVRVLGDGEVIKRPTTHVDCMVQLLFGVSVMQPTAIHRSSDLKQYELRFEPDWPRYGEDWMFQARAAKYVRFGNIDEELVQYRRGEQGVSFGKDRALELPERIRFAFEQFGWEPPTEVEMAVHLMALGIFVKDPNAEFVQAFRDHLNELQKINSLKGTFDDHSLNEKLTLIWDRFLYALPAHGIAPVHAYIKAGGKLNMARSYYVMGSLMRRVIGSKGN